VLVHLTTILLYPSALHVVLIGAKEETICCTEEKFAYFVNAECILLCTNDLFIRNYLVLPYFRCRSELRKNFDWSFFVDK
jgi:hypothetical protein